jgi:hypothetical protein
MERANIKEFFVSGSHFGMEPYKDMPVPAAILMMLFSSIPYYS